MTLKGKSGELIEVLKLTSLDTSLVFKIFDFKDRMISGKV